VTQQVIRVEHDAEGIRVATMELLEEGFQRAKIERGSGLEADTPQRAKAEAKRREQQIDAIEKRRTLAAGYYTFVQHVLRLDAERAVGLTLDPHTLASFEGSALRTLAACRNEHRAKHPTCSRCGTEQDSRFHPKCTGCGAEFAKKGKK